jgi:hypothetical protein
MFGATFLAYNEPDSARLPGSALAIFAGQMSLYERRESAAGQRWRAAFYVCLSVKKRMAI